MICGWDNMCGLAGCVCMSPLRLHICSLFALFVSLEAMDGVNRRIESLHQNEWMYICQRGG